MVWDQGTPRAAVTTANGHRLQQHCVVILGECFVQPPLMANYGDIRALYHLMETSRIETRLGMSSVILASEVW